MDYVDTHLTSLDPCDIYRDETVHKWPNHTILIAGSSMVQNLDERRLGNSKYKVKVRHFSGATIQDMYFHLAPLLRKSPEILILHIGSNNCVNDSSRKVLYDLMCLKSHIERISPDIKIIISQPIVRYDVDDSALACLTQRHLIKKINNIDCDIVDNSNIVRLHVGKRGLHLNEIGTARLAMNITSLIRRL